MSTTHTIGIITEQFGSHHHTPLLHMLHTRLRQRGYRMLCIMGTPGEVAAARLAFDQVDGWLVLNLTEGIDDLARAGKPLVLVGGVIPDLPCVVPDNHTGTAGALTHLIGQGRGRIAFITHAVNPDFRERYAAYVATLAEHGIALDSALVLDTKSYTVLDAYQAVRRMIADGQRFDAAFCANDWLAFGAMQAVQEAGWRIPEDVAVIGFDDTPDAQFASPPLTSVRQNPAELGRVALEVLLKQIEHGVAPASPITVPTALIVRESSTAIQHTRSASQKADDYCGADWQAQLARDLAQQAILPVPLAPDMLAEQVWPGVELLVAALADTIDGQEPRQVPRDVWERAYRLCGGGEPLRQIVALLRRAGMQQIDAADGHAVERLMGWLLVCQWEITQQQVAANSNQAERDRQMFNSESVLLRQIGAAGASSRVIDWMAQSYADWAVLGLWQQGQDGADTRQLDISSIYERENGASPSQKQVAPEQFPPLGLLSAPVRDSLEFLIKVSPVGTAERQWGYMAYAERFVWTLNDTLRNRSTYIAAALEREELLESVQERQRTLQEAYDRERTLAGTIRELGCPIIPLMKGVLLVPLIGTIDSSRAAEIIERVLEGVGHEQAERVLLDITGVPLVDTQVAAALLQTARAAALLGAKVTLVGVRPEIAQSIVGLGTDLGMLETRAVLAAALPSLVKR